MHCQRYNIAIDLEHPTRTSIMSGKDESPAVAKFREYLRVNTMQPNPDYDGAVKFLQKMAGELDLPCRVLEMVPGKPIVLITWEGTDPSLPSVLLNSHIDVVPVFPECWKYEPFAAFKDEKGDIYARGSQDMKCVGMQYVEAIRKLKAEGKTFLRTLHMSFVPDEEIGGRDGMALFAKHEEFNKLNLGFALDEGLANPNEAFTLYYSERCPWWVEVTCTGNPGHGSRFIEGDAGSKMRRVIDSFMDFRNEQEQKLLSNPKLRLGDVTTTNLNILSGGIQENVVPADLKAVFDVRVTPSTDLVQLEKTMHQWCAEAGEGIKINFLQQFLEPRITPTTKDDPWWSSFSTACDKMDLKLELEIFPAATDSRFVRAVGVPALGFSPMNHTPILLHDHNEYLNENIYLRGIDIYCEILPSLADTPAFTKG